MLSVQGDHSLFKLDFLDAEKDHNRYSRRPRGLTFLAFTCSLTLLTAIVLGAAVVGVLGSILADEGNEKKLSIQYGGLVSGNADR